MTRSRNDGLRADLRSARSPVLVVVMGVSAAGKSSVAAALAERLEVPWVDADDLHPKENTAKIAAGHPLTDEDRWPWLATVGSRLAASHEAGGVVVACSALRRTYRDRIRAHAPETLFIHLTGPNALLAERAQNRTGHFMPPALLESQLAALEPLDTDEAGTTLQVQASVEDLAADAERWVSQRVTIPGT